MKQDWNTYSGGRLAIAWTADVIPIEASALGGLAGTTIGGPGAVLSGSFGSITGAILGDWAKYKIKENLPKDTHGE